MNVAQNDTNSAQLNPIKNPQLDHFVASQAQFTMANNFNGQYNPTAPNSASPQQQISLIQQQQQNNPYLALYMSQQPQQGGIPAPPTFPPTQPGHQLPPQAAFVPYLNSMNTQMTFQNSMFNFAQQPVNYPQFHNNYQQNLQRAQQQQQQPPPSQPAPPTQQQQQQQANGGEIDQVSMKHLTAAFRVGMLGLEALPRRVDGSHQIKYRQSPPYADDVKWLWEVSVKLGNKSLEQFCQTAATVIQNPFLLQELAFDSANHLTHGNPSQFSLVLCSPMLNVLVQRCINSYLRSCMSKLHHITPNEHEDFINMILTARNVFYYSGNMNCFSDLVQNLRRSNRCKKDLWSKICNALNTHNYN